MDLLRPRKSVTEIALSLGYANPSKFAAAFQKVTGLAPREWTRHIGSMKASAGG